jgi:hypothetical protein
MTVSQVGFGFLEDAPADPHHASVVDQDIDAAQLSLHLRHGIG